MSSPSTDITDLHPLEVKLLRAVVGGEGVFPEDEALAERAGLEEAQLRSALGWLQNRGVLEVAEQDDRDEVSLGELGESYRTEKPPELRIFARLEESPVPMKDLKAAFDGLDPAVVGKAFGALKKAGAVEIDRGSATASAGADLSGFETLQGFLDRLADAPLAVDGLGDAEKALVKEHGRRRGS